jgi:hypothetical protein
MLDRHFVASVMLGLLAGTLGTVAYVAGRRRLRRYRGRPATRMALDLALLFGISLLALILILSVNSWLARVRASYNPQILVLSMLAPLAIASLVAERRVRREQRH